MSDLRWEINTDGTLSEAVPQMAKKLKELLIEMFSQFSWTCSIIENNGAFYRMKIENATLNRNLHVNVYAGKIRREDPNRSHYEKKIQLGTLDPRTKMDELTLILGIYVKEENDPLKEVIIVAWPIEMEKNYPINPSLRVNTKEDMQKAKINGFYIDETTGKRVVAFRPEFIFYYLENYKKFHQYKNSLSEDRIEKGIGSTIIEHLDYPHNRILFGAPGTGKSYKIEEQRVVFGENYERVTFHPNYSYAQFVGTYKPKPKFRTDGTEYVSYEFAPGPFLRTWIKSQNSIKNGKSENYLLVIEEINRANVAAVFGDVFQLLDRKTDGTSEYDIGISEDMRDYLINECKFTSNEISKIKIPGNMYIWTTMNSADQGVLPMDSAFKRRWNFEYIGINEGSSTIAGKSITLKPYGTIEWDMLRKKINNRLTQPDLNINEDKLIGPFFLSDKEINSKSADEIFKCKLLMYLFEDVLKHRKGKLFKSELNTFSKVIDTYNDSEEIFDFDVIISSSDESNEEVALSSVDKKSGKYLMGNE